MPTFAPRDVLRVFLGASAVAALLVSIAAADSAQAAANYRNDAAVRAALEQLRTESPAEIDARWGALGRLAGNVYLDDATPAFTQWRQFDWLVEGAVMAYSSGYCDAARKCERVDFLLEYDAQHKAIHAFEKDREVTVELAPDGVILLPWPAPNNERLQVMMGAAALRVGPAFILPRTTHTRLLAFTHGLGGDQAKAAQESAGAANGIPSQPAQTAHRPAPSADEDLRAQLAALQGQVAALTSKVREQAAAAAPPPLQFASLAVHRKEKGRYGTARNRDSADEAQREALKACNTLHLNHPGGCETILTWGGNGCGSYRAIDPAVGDAWGAGLAPGIASSQQLAMQEARKYSHGQTPSEYASAYECNFNAGGDLTVVYELAHSGGEPPQARSKEAAPARGAAARAQDAPVTASASRAPTPQPPRAPTPPAANSAPARGGRYTNGAGYFIDVEFRDGALIVVEPNKRSAYRQVHEGYYEFVNPVNGIAYCMRVIDRTTLEACKPGRDDGTRLTLVPSGDTTSSVAANERSRLERIGESYLQRAQSDPADAQTWSFCSLAAMARAQGQSQAQVQQAAAALKTITSTQANPCPDAIPGQAWDAAN